MYTYCTNDVNDVAQLEQSEWLTLVFINKKKTDRRQKS